MSTIFDLANDILKSADIVEVVSHFIKLEKRGKNYEALCPFHDDKKLGNFYVSPDKGIFKCFACNSGGNAITFVQKYTNCSFAEAVKKTAEIIGYKDDRLNEFVQVKKIDPKIQNIYDCLKDIANFYETSLYQSEDSKDALDYLHNRGLSDEVIKYFKIGYAQLKGENIINFLTKKGYSLQTISDAGILNLSQTPYRDINSGRIAFTITDRDNNVVGFSCRKFREFDDSNAKYINTSSTKVFNKSNILFNLYNGSIEARKVGYIYILEGFMDVIACYRAGIKAAIGLMGTALTKENIQQLRYLKCDIRLCLDLDNPGQTNTIKIAQLLDENSIKYEIVSNNVDFKEKDSDEILKSYGSEKLRSYLTTLINKGEYLINYYSRHTDLTSLENKKDFLSKMIPFLGSLKDPLDYEEYVNKVNLKTGFSKDIINKYVKKSVKSATKEDAKIADDEEERKLVARDKVISRLNLAEKQVLRYMLENKEAVKIYQERLGYFVEPSYRNIASSIEEFIVHQGDTKDYDVQNIVNYLSDDSCNITNKNKVINDISGILIDTSSFPPYSEEEMLGILDTINIEKAKNRVEQDLEASSKGQSDIEKAELAKAAFARKTNLIQDLDKKRR